MVPLWNARLVVSPAVLVQHVAGEAVVLDLASETYFGLNEVGARLLALVRERGTAEAAFPQLLAEYEVEAPTLRRDIEVLVQELLDRGLVRIEPTSSHP